MKDWTAIRERYLRDSLPVRLGGLAANLSRIKSFATQNAGRDAVESMLDESKHFIEWTAAKTEIQTAAQLGELQVQMARWQLTWTKTWSDPPIVTPWGDLNARVQDPDGLQITLFQVREQAE